MFNKKKHKTQNPIIGEVKKNIARAKQEGKLSFYLHIEDRDIDYVRNYFKNLKIDLDYQVDGLFFYKISGFAEV